LIQKEAGKVLLAIVLPASLVQFSQRTCYYETVINLIAQLDVKQHGGCLFTKKYIRVNTMLFIVESKFYASVIQCMARGVSKAAVCNSFGDTAYKNVTGALFLPSFLDITRNKATR
jgi:hypothetical protein